MRLASIEVRLIDSMGNDHTVVRSARISFGRGAGGLLTDRDKHLIEYLANHGHYSPFEHCTATLLIKCPLYIRSQIHRHRTFSYNEISRRYTAENMEFYIPFVLNKQGSANKQSGDEQIDTSYALAKSAFRHAIENSLHWYHELLGRHGVSREQARSVLPQNLMTRFYMTGNLRNWAAFIKVRDHEDAQREVQIVADGCRKIIRELFPYSFDALISKGD